MEFRLGFDEINWPWREPKPSQKIREKAQSYLTEKGIGLEELALPQQQCVFAYMRQKRGVKFTIPLMILVAIGGGLLTLFLYSMLADFIEFFRMPEDIVRRYSVEESVTPDLKTIEIYGELCAMYAAYSVFAACACFFTVISLLDQFYQKRKTEKILNAFLSQNQQD